MSDDNSRLLKEIEKYDTPAVSNAVASYPADTENCLRLYSPWSQNWYSNSDLRCNTPENGCKAGYAVTYVIGEPEPGWNGLSYEDVLRAIDASPKPVVVVCKQDFSENLKKKAGILGDMLGNTFKKLGACAVISDGPGRDVDEVAKLGIQYLTNGVAPGHGITSIKAVNVPVSVCGMDVAPGEIICCDKQGACKFPASSLEDVARLLPIRADNESRCAGYIRNAADDFDSVLEAFRKK